MAEKSCHDRALGLLAARPHFRAELAAKLTARGYEGDEVAATLDRLAAKGLVDDAAAVRSFLSTRQQRQGLGKARLRAELLRRGAPAELVRQALADIGDDDDLALAREAAARWRRGGSRAAGPAGKAALARHLDRRGFSRRAVLTVLAEGAGPGAGVELDEDARAEPVD